MEGPTGRLARLGAQQNNSALNGTETLWERNPFPKPRASVRCEGKCRDSLQCQRHQRALLPPSTMTAGQEHSAGCLATLPRLAQCALDPGPIPARLPPGQPTPTFAPCLGAAHSPRTHHHSLCPLQYSSRPENSLSPGLGTHHSSHLL